MNKKTIRNIDWNGKRALIRVDLNVPLDEQRHVTDDTRIKASLPTVRYILDRGGSAVLMTHLGRPKKKVVDELRLTPVAERLEQLLGRPVKRLDVSTGQQAEEAARSLKPGEVLLLENLRFDPREESNDESMAQELARLGDVYVNDAFGTAHRAHASTAGVARFLPSVAGMLMERELAALGGAIENPERPLVAIIGGAKISDKIAVIQNLLQKVDALLIGGGMANTFLLAQGYAIGDSLAEPDSANVARSLIETAEGRPVPLLLPVDVVIADAFDADASTKTVGVDEVPEGWRILDIGPRSVELFSETIKTANTIIWNGPMGVFEMEPFAKGTRAVAQAVADATDAGAISIIGGGDSVAAVEQMGLANKISHISTGGGASLELLEGRVLPGIDALND